MPKALRWVRKSKGRDDDVGLEEQREGTKLLADELADAVDTLDLGVHTGFSIHSRDPDEERIDAREDVMDALARLEAGEYDYLVAWDDSRLARDEFFAAIDRACILGHAEIRYVSDVTDDSLAFDVRRAVEKKVKQDEIQKSKDALARRREQGYDEGRPPIGFQYDADGRYWIPDEEFDTVLEAIDRVERGESYRDVQDALGIAPSTLVGVVDRKERYLEAEEAPAVIEGGHSHA